jgi:hypothetical protein
MPTNLVRMRFAAVAAKIETTPGVDAIATTPASADWLAGSVEVDFGERTSENPELTGSLDRAPGIFGGLRPTITVRVPLRGSGAAGTAPEFGKMMRACTYAETVTSSSVGAPTALPVTGHTETSVTLASSPFAGTAQAYRGMPLVLSGDVADTTGITDYTAGRVATLASTLSAVPDGDTLAQVPVNVLYTPTSDETVYKTVTLYFFADGIRWRFVGCVGTWSLELTTGEIGFIVFQMRGQLLDESTSALPDGWSTVNRPTPPRWVNGRAQLRRVKAQLRSLRIDAGVGVVLPDDPEALEGVGPAVPIERASVGTLDPLMDTTTQVALFSAIKDGANMTLMAIIGSTAGNRFLVTVPAARVQARGLGNREGLGSNEIRVALDGADSAVFLAAF